VLGSYTVAPRGLSYDITITLVYGEQGAVSDPVHPPARPCQATGAPHRTVHFVTDQGRF
jgi:hypothetical protein